MSPRAAHVLVIAGAPGTGRSSALNRLAAKLRAEGTEAVQLRLTPGERDRPFALVQRLAFALATGAPAGLRDAVLGHTGGRPLAILIDDIQWADAQSLPALTTLVHDMVGQRLTVAVTVRLPVVHRPLRAVFSDLRARSLADLVTLRGLTASGTREYLADLLGAPPSERLTGLVHELSRGVPAAVHAAVDALDHSAGIHLADGVAHLIRRPGELRWREPERWMSWMAELDQRERAVAEAFAVLGPLGTAANELVATSAGISGTHELTAAARRLWSKGLLVAGPEPGSWRFRVPLVAHLIVSGLPPYRRLRLSELAIRAIRRGDAPVPSPDFLADRLAVAARTTGLGPAVTDLLRHADAARRGEPALPLLRLGAELSGEPQQRADVLRRHALAAVNVGDFRSALHTADLALREHHRELPASHTATLSAIQVIGLIEEGDRDRLRTLADRGTDRPRRAADDVLARAAALCALGQWRRAHQTLRTAEWSRGDPVTAAIGHLIGRGTAAVLGLPSAGAAGSATEAGGLPADPAGAGLAPEAGAMLELLRFLLFGLGPRPPDRLLRPGRDRGIKSAGHTVVHRELADTLVAQGQLTRARALLAAGRPGQAPLGHLLYAAQARLAGILLDSEGSLRIATEGLTLATRRGIVTGTDELWALLTEWAVAVGNPGLAHGYAMKVRQAVARQRTDRARLNLLRTDLALRARPETADEALRLARDRGNPLELTGTVVGLARIGLVDRRHLQEAYEVAGAHGALLCRAQIRRLMKSRRVPVPDRRGTLAETERLVATLVAEGLSNRELAAALECSEKSVEGLLSRLFKRAGLRSRVELIRLTLASQQAGRGRLPAGGEPRGDREWDRTNS